MAHVRVQAWQQAYQGILPDELLVNLDKAAIAKRWSKQILSALNQNKFALVAEDPPDQIFGIAIAGPERSGDKTYQAEI